MTALLKIGVNLSLISTIGNLLRNFEAEIRTYNVMTFLISGTGEGDFLFIFLFQAVKCRICQNYDL